jgi:hypothetical protein
MDNYIIGHVFAGDYPFDAALWCDKNNAMLEPLADRGYVIVAKPAPSPDMIKQTYENAVQAFLDATAKSRGYDNTYTCLSYRDSTNEVWKREANAFNVWRDSVWTKCHEILNAVMSGQIEQPSVNEVIAQMPEIDWGDADEQQK